MFTRFNITKNRQSRRPNIVFILADDLGYGDISCFGQRRFSTPNIDKLAENGMRFSSLQREPSLRTIQMCSYDRPPLRTRTYS